ncbi:MAG: galactokinase, partial [Spirochaetia bacterium]|nr:galactokinase [Spirochaetia bacterium]
ISPGFSDVIVDISSLDMVENEKNSTDSLVRGIAHAFVLRGLKVGGLIIHTTTNVLKGSGLSSSAAIEVLIATIFNSMFNNEKLEPVELAIIGQYAENVYFGKPSGLMDQIACAVGNVVKIDFKEPKKPIVTTVPVDFLAHGYQLMIIDTKGDHANLGDEYGAIPAEMKMVASFFDKQVVREITVEQFTSSIKELRESIGNDRALLRAYHFLLENERVGNMEKALLDDDIPLYLEYVKASGASSLHFLQNIYAPQHPTVQPISIALMMCDQLLSSDGAARVHGGGFAGTVQVYVPVALSSKFTEKARDVFGEDSVTLLTIRSVPTCRVDNF